MTTTDTRLHAAFDLGGRIGVVTGASKGIGRAATTVLAEAGATVVAVARGRSELEELREELTCARGEVMPLVADVALPSTYDGIAEAVADLVGPRIDFLVNNAGVLPKGRLEDMSVSEWDETLAMNLRAPALITARLLGHLRRSDSASVVNVASVHALLGLADRSVYAASKGGMVALTRQLAIELAVEGIRVNVVCPGVVVTPMSEPLLSDQETRQRLEAVIPLGRIGEAFDIAAALAYLISPASAYVTGQTLVVDGGWAAS